ncbi:MAG: YceI family protein [Planctomycetota bacterium]
MAKTFLAWLGLVALIAVAGASAAGLLLVKDRLRIVFQDAGTPDAQAQQVAQLRDELGQVQRDVQALASALGQGLRQLAEDDAADTAHRHAELLQSLERARESVHSVAAEVTASHGMQQSLSAALERLEGAVRSLPRPVETLLPTASSVQPGGQAPSSTSSASQGSSADAEPAAEQTGATRDPEATASASPPETAAALEAPKASVPAAPRRRSAFAFSLPSQRFAFDLKQRFELLPNLSRVGFDAKSTLHDFSGVTSKLHGAVELNLADPTGPCAGEIRVDARALDTGLAGRNDAMREHLGASEWPEIVFTFQTMTADEVDVAAQRVRGKVRGQMTIRGKTRDLEMPVELSVDGSKRVHAKGEAALKLSDYDVPVPSQLGMIKMQDEVTVWIALQARALGKETPR